MLLKKIIKKNIKRVIAKMGYVISKTPNSKSSVVLDIYTKFTMDKALDRCKKRGLKIKTVIDVGASNGSWSKQCMNIFPNVNYFLIEAQKGHQEALVQFKNEFSNVNYILAAAGNKDGVIYFDESGLFGGVASESKFEKNCIEVPMISIDNEVKRKNLMGPYLLKLDTHGFEIPILEGAKELIKSAELIIIETYNYKLTSESLKYFEMCKYMENLGFSPVEMVDLMLREHDNTFWQMDTFFVPSRNSNFSCNSYK